MEYQRSLAIILASLASSCKSLDFDSTQLSRSELSPKASLSYPQPDPELGEFLHKGEIEAAEKITPVIERQIRQRYANDRRMLRDAHPKAHGCIKADFVVNSEIMPEMAKGVFSHGSRYKAIIRFSNGNADPTQPDIVGDARGMAIKILNVPGKKLLDIESEAETQDFIMINHPVFFIADPEEYLSLVEKSGSSNIFSKLSILASLGIKGSRIASEIKSKQIPSPIQAAYFSMVPYQLGSGAQRVAVRYKAEPCAINGTESVPKDTKDADYLRHRLRAHFEKNDACYTIYAQVREGSRMSVEDSREEWDSPWKNLATLNIRGSEQEIANTAASDDPKNIACDTLSFNPWHSLPEHKPLGVMNRMRKSIYEHISRVRHVGNNEERKEP